MPKFSKPNELGYKRVVGRISTWLEKPDEPHPDPDHHHENSLEEGQGNDGPLGKPDEEPRSPPRGRQYSQ